MYGEAQGLVTSGQVFWGTNDPGQEYSGLGSSSLQEGQYEIDRSALNCLTADLGLCAQCDVVVETSAVGHELNRVFPSSRVQQDATDSTEVCDARPALPWLPFAPPGGSCESEYVRRSIRPIGAH